MISLSFIYLSCRVQRLFYPQHMQRMLIFHTHTISRMTKKKMHERKEKKKEKTCKKKWNINKGKNYS